MRATTCEGESRRTMKICMLLMNEFTHDARVNKEALSLVSAGHTLLVCALKSRETAQEEVRNGIKIYRVKVHLRYLLPKGAIFFFIKYLEYIAQTVRSCGKIQCDAYHAHDLETLPIGCILAALRKRPLVYDSHELYPDMETHHPIARRIWYFLEKLLIRRPALTITINESISAIYARRYGITPPRVIMNCQHHNHVRRKSVLRDRLAIPADDKILIYQGKLLPGRGLDILMETMNYLQHVTLVILGSGSHREALEGIRDAQRNKEKIFLVDEVPWEVLPHYTASADLGISLPQNISQNNYYSLPNKIFEYLSAGLPVVFSDFPEMRTLILGHRVGLVVNERDPAAVAKAVDTIITNPVLYAEMSDNARRIIRETYNWYREEEKLLSIYDSDSAISLYKVHPTRWYRAAITTEPPHAMNSNNKV